MDRFELVKHSLSCVNAVLILLDWELLLVASFLFVGLSMCMPVFFHFFSLKVSFLIKKKIQYLKKKKHTIQYTPSEKQER